MVAKREAGTLDVKRTYLKYKTTVDQEFEQEIITVREFAVEPARVGVEFGLTLNMGDYESARLSVRVELPCYVEEINDVYQQASAFVEAKAKEEVASVKGLVTPRTPF